MFHESDWLRQSKIVCDVLRKAPDFDRDFRIGEDEFQSRQQRVIQALKDNDFDCGIVYTDEHYCGDVPYLAGNTNVTTEPLAGVIGPNGFFLMAGLEGCYCAEQLASRSHCKIRKVEMLKLADEDYPVDAVKVDEVLEEACGKRPERIALLSPSQVIPISVYKCLLEYLHGDASRIVDAQELYYKIKYIKSDSEMQMMEQASKICDYMLEGMIRVIRPGMYETQVAQWGYAIARELGVEQLSFEIGVGAGESNRTIIGKAMNRKIQEGDYVYLGVGPKWDGLSACERASVVCVKDPKQLTRNQRFWFDFIEEGFTTGLTAYKKAAAEDLPASVVERAIVDFFASKSQEVSRMYGRPVDMTVLKPYTSVHNAGYTECQEFYGAITLNSNEPAGSQVVNMLDVAAKGIRNDWNDVVIPDMDYILIEKTLGKYGKQIRVMNDLPLNLQHLVGENF